MVLEGSSCGLGARSGVGWGGGGVSRDGNDRDERLASHPYDLEFNLSCGLSLLPEVFLLVLWLYPLKPTFLNSHLI